MKTIIDRIDKVIYYIATMSAWLLVPMIVAMLANIILRYVFSMGFIPLQESVVYFHILVVMLVIPYTLQLDGHVRLDVFYCRYHIKTKARINLIGHFLFLIPVCAVLFYYAWDYVVQSWQIKESSKQPGGIPFLFALKTVLLIMPALLVLQATSEMLKCIKRLR